MTIETRPGPDSTVADGAIHLRNGAISVVIGSGGLPAVLYWGPALPLDDAVLRDLLTTADPAVMNSSFDTPRRVSALPGQHDGWSGTPALEWHDGDLAGTGYTLVGSSRPGESSARFAFDSRDGRLRVDLAFDLLDSGVLALRAELRNTTTDSVVDVSAARLSMPLPQRAQEVLDFTGRWSGERREQRHSLLDGTWRRATHRGRPGHDAAFVTAVGTPGFGYGHGEVWAAHIAWSGSQEQYVERLPEGVGAMSSLLGAAEVLEPGEIRLRPGQVYTTPTALFAYSERGLDGIAQAFQSYGRTSPAYPSGPRPLVLNTWEAVYFDHDVERLRALADAAAAIGVERFVLDDGWFHGRRDDTRGLGDWWADDAVWPHGLADLSAYVHDRGMQFGLWFEPEMVNLDSDLARRHPDWILGAADKPTTAARHQFVLDLTIPAAYEHILRMMRDAVSQWGVDFIKWDHNRDLHNPVSSATGRPSAHRQTVAFYRLIDELRAAHPGLEIESCASGGGRIDAGVLQHAQRVWASDTNDPVERTAIQRNTALLVPPELIGVHVGPGESHTTHRTSALSFRLALALFGHAGIEWDLTTCSPEELATLRAWAAMYRELRPLLHGGVTSHADDLDTGTFLTTVAADDGTHAIAAWTRLDTSPAAHTPRVRIPGLSAHASYEVRVRTELGLPSFHHVAAPAWLPLDAPRRVHGRILTEVGVPLPLLNPGNTLLLEFTRILDNVN